MAMDRRNFIKSCVLVTLSSIFFGCKKDTLLEGISTAKVPEIKQFEDEVRLAISVLKLDMDLTPVPYPKGDALQKNRFGMVIDVNACNGCGKCILACNKENNIPLATIEDANQKRFMHWINLRGGVPFMCAHCGNAPCEKVCPTGAASHSQEGLSTMMYKRCAGSRFCGANCPMEARKFNFHDNSTLGLSRVFNPKVPIREKGVMEKCTLCLHRIQENRLQFKTENPTKEWRGEGLQTACAEACPKNAIVFGNWLDPKSPLVKAVTGKTLYAPKSLAPFDPSVLFIMGER